MKEKRFKVVFKSQTNSYELWFTDHKGEWCLSAIYNTFTIDGKAIESEYDDQAMISENALWGMDKLIYLGYKFIGIERS